MTRETRGRLGGLIDRAYAAVEVLIREVAKFGTIGLLAFILDTTLYNLLAFGVPGSGEVGLMHAHPLLAKILSTSVATVFAWLGNRYWTFRTRRGQKVHHEFALFVVANVLGLSIALACLGFSRYVLGLDSQLADNVSGNGVGLVLGTLFRFWAYRTFVFKEDALADIEVPMLHHEDPDGHDGQGDRSRQGRSQPAGAMDT